MHTLIQQRRFQQALPARRQAVHDAYNAGWDAHYQDILSQLHPEDHRMLRWILEHLDREDDPSLS